MVTWREALSSTYTNRGNIVIKYQYASIAYWVSSSVGLCIPKYNNEKCMHHLQYDIELGLLILGTLTQHKKRWNK